MHLLRITTFVGIVLWSPPTLHAQSGPAAGDKQSLARCEDDQGKVIFMDAAGQVDSYCLGVLLDKRHPHRQAERAGAAPETNTSPAALLETGKASTEAGSGRLAPIETCMDSAGNVFVMRTPSGGISAACLNVLRSRQRAADQVPAQASPSAPSTPIRIEIAPDAPPEQPAARDMTPKLVWRSMVRDGVSSIVYGVPDSTENVFAMKCTRETKKVEFHTSLGSKLLKKNLTSIVKMTAGKTAKSFRGKTYFNEMDGGIWTQVSVDLTDVASLFLAGGQLAIEVKGDKKAHPLAGSEEAFARFSSGCKEVWSNPSASAKVIAPLALPNPRLSKDEVAMLLATIITASAKCNYVPEAGASIPDLVRASGYRYEEFTAGAEYEPLVNQKIDNAVTAIRSMGLQHACQGMRDTVGIYWPQVWGIPTQPVRTEKTQPFVHLPDDETAMLLASYVMLESQCGVQFNPDFNLRAYGLMFAQDVADYVPGGSRANLMKDKMSLLADRIRVTDKVRACKDIEATLRASWPRLFDK